ncbi:probable tRNA (uracil-O(2)-)-methyltransferase [Phlebotomus argentipes]|uniref:probable tRNA (uracil-O(2)-)-methyltransferase n=1 Tax=Phlebotomus argentipes TaxID=94469 RepID=UPI002892E31D|nr:probable tRNA (uracil-O(2)-)-methyltransferase [Phlebotomus argentipes]
MDFCEKTVEKVMIELEEQQFWNMIAIHTFNPQLLNRRIVGGAILGTFSWPQQEYNLQSAIKTIQKNQKLGVIEEFLPLESTRVKILLQEDCQRLTSCVIKMKLLQKNLQNSQLFLIVFLDVPSKRVSFFTYQEEEGNLFLKSGYYLAYKSPEFELGSYSGASGNILDGKIDWLKPMFPRFLKWMTSEAPKGQFNIPSLSLVNIEEYSVKYSQLKEKYGEDLVRDWPEVTDPQKFVFEDIAIAAYLITLWQEERKLMGSSQFQSFVDVGCGNGLLVFILTSEGYPGIGVDLRKRKIWDVYPESVKLLEKTINPMEDDEIPPTDWIIGNHSDEMSPWIPVLAAKNSPNCRFFLLPCCAYEFNGNKYQRRNCKNSLYHDFINYAMEISEICGFSIELDRLRIPSTKRICIIGKSRSALNRESLERFIEEKSSAKFQAREALEKVRNCTQVPKNITSQIVEIVFSELLKCDEKFNTGDDWNAGGSIDLPEIVQKIPQELLKALKDECGGLQTLLRNNNQIFEVIKGQVRIRDPRKISQHVPKSRKPFKRKFKEKDCWFHQNHPNGCPLSDPDCSFRHSAPGTK